MLKPYFQCYCRSSVRPYDLSAYLCYWCWSTYDLRLAVATLTAYSNIAIATTSSITVLIIPVFIAIVVVAILNVGRSYNYSSNISFLTIMLK
jgi:hypothetical protein